MTTDARSHLAPERLFSLDGKVAMITGAAGGIGSALARGFSAAGAALVLADRNEAVRARATELQPAGDVSAAVFDVTDPAAVERAIADAVAEHGRLDIVVNNAAIIVRKPFLELTVDDWRTVIDTDLTAYFIVAQRAAKAMTGQGAGRIINVGSIMGHVSRPMLVPYVSAKGAVAAFTRALAADLAGTGITCNAIAPGYTATEFGMASDPTFHDFVADWTPLGRWGTPEDLCGTALLLASAAGAYINGQVIYVDGGFIAVTK
jgi:gluconate 5-dehydrogenase